MSMNTLEVTKRCMELIGKVDIPGWCALMDPDCIFSCPFSPVGKRIEGRDKMLELLSRLFSNVKSFTWRDVKYYQTDDPEIVFVTARSEVETRNGKPYGNQYAILCQVRDGVVLEWREYNDPAPITAAFSDFF